MVARPYAGPSCARVATSWDALPVNPSPRPAAEAARFVRISGEKEFHDEILSHEKKFTRKLPRTTLGMRRKQARGWKISRLLVCRWVPRPPLRKKMRARLCVYSAVQQDTGKQARSAGRLRLPVSCRVPRTASQHRLWKTAPPEYEEKLTPAKRSSRQEEVLEVLTLQSPHAEVLLTKRKTLLVPEKKKNKIKQNHTHGAGPKKQHNPY